MTRLIDAHHHLWDLQAVHYPWLAAKGVERFFGDPTPIQRDYLLDEFRSQADAHGFSSSVHIQVGAEDPMAEAQWVQKVADANPDWPMVQVVFCDLTAPDAKTSMEAFLELPNVRGVRQIVGRAPGEDALTGTNTLLDDPRFIEGLKTAGELGLSYDLQLIPELMEKTTEILRQVPETKVALCHAGSPHDRSPKGLAYWASHLGDMAKLPNVTCKLSGLGMFDHDWETEDFRPLVETVLEKFAPDRVMYGSNFPVDSLYSNYEKLITSMRELVPETDHAAVFGGTAARFYRF